MEEAEAAEAEVKGWDGIPIQHLRCSQSRSAIVSGQEVEVLAVQVAQEQREEAEEMQAAAETARTVDLAFPGILR